MARRRHRLSSTPLADFVVASCDGKSSFECYAQAAAVARRHGRRGDKVHPYRCQYCRRWHIGTTKRGGRRRRWADDDVVDS